jgi:hypothetical protein
MNAAARATSGAHMWGYAALDGVFQVRQHLCLMALAFLWKMFLILPSGPIMKVVPAHHFLPGTCFFL